MSPRPVIFISAVSKELKSARQLVANTLTFLSYEPEWQDIFSTEGEDLRAMLRRRVDASKGVVQLVGECYGTEPPQPDEAFGRVSYTQYEALYARQKGKKVWYLIVDETFPTDAHEEEDEEKQALQNTYRAKVKTDAHLFHPLTSREGLETSVLKLRDDLTQLRRGVKQWAAFVAILLILIAAAVVWLLQRQQQAAKGQAQFVAKQDETNRRLVEMREIINKLPQKEAEQRSAGAKEDSDAVRRRAIEALAKEYGIDPKKVEEQLPHFAEQLKRAPDATTIERANAAYAENDYAEAERLALAAADEAQKATPPKTSDAIKAFERAAWAAEKRIEYARALQRLRKAEAFTDRARDPLEWARVQFGIAYILHNQGQYREVEPILREVLKERERALGPEHPSTLTTRNNLANALDFQGKYAEAEAEHRAVFKLREKVLGPEHPDTLMTRNNLASALWSQGKDAEAEAEHRAGLKIEEKVLGPEHPDTLATRNNLANALCSQGKYAEAEAEYRAVLKLKDKVLGPEHPDTLAIRGNLGETLRHQGKYAEAEAEHRAVLKLREKVLGPEHPSTLGTRMNLANVLHSQGKHAEAEAEYRVVLKLNEKVFGSERPDTLRTCFNLAICLRDQGKKGEAKEFAKRAVEGGREVLGAEHPYTKRFEELWQELQVGEK